jgi:hypothetical protein
MNRLVWTCVIVAALGAFAVWFVSKEPPGVRPATHSHGDAGSSSLPTAPTESSLRDDPTPAVRTRRDVLRDYWGAQWSEIEGAMEAAGTKLDEPAPTIPPWESVAADFERLLPMKDGERASILRNNVGWPDEPTMEGLRSTLKVKLPEHLSDAELGSIVTIGERHNYDLRDRATRYVDRIDEILLEQFHRDEFGKAPYSTTGIPETGKTYFYSTSRAGNGWAMKMGICLDDHPELVSLQDEIKLLRLTRDKEIHEYVKSL